MGRDSQEITHVAFMHVLYLLRMKHNLICKEQHNIVQLQRQIRKEIVAPGIRISFKFPILGAQMLPVIPLWSSNSLHR